MQLCTSFHQGRNNSLLQLINLSVLRTVDAKASYLSLVEDITYCLDGAEGFIKESLTFIKLLTVEKRGTGLFSKSNATLKIMCYEYVTFFVNRGMKVTSIAGLMHVYSLASRFLLSESRCMCPRYLIMSN